jgi:hypothetical protein
MPFRILILVVTMLAMGAGVDITVARQPPSRPNVVLIITDDLGYGDLGSYGGTDAKTPNLDRLARDGVRLTDAYERPELFPTRAALISGRYQQRVGIEWPLASATDQDRGQPVTGASLPALLKKNGYTTGLGGKWPLGFKSEFGPHAHGFDEFFGFLSGALDYYSHLRGDGVPDLYENTMPVESPPISPTKSRGARSALSIVTAARRFSRGGLQRHPLAVPATRSSAVGSQAVPRLRKPAIADCFRVPRIRCRPHVKTMCGCSSALTRALAPSCQRSNVMG